MAGRKYRLTKKLNRLFVPKIVDGEERLIDTGKPGEYVFVGKAEKINGVWHITKDDSAYWLEPQRYWDMWDEIVPV